MSINRALVDLARRVYEDEVPVEDFWEGEPPPPEPRRGAWFRCRLTMQRPREVGANVEEGVGRVEGDAELMFGVQDVDGGFLQDPDGVFVGFDVDDQLEVASPDLGTRVWRVSSGVEPIRTRKRVIGWMVGLSATRTPAVDGRRR